MPVYRDREKKKYPLRGETVFGPEAGRMGGTDNRIKRPFCLPDRLCTYNLHESIRQDAIDYFILQVAFGRACRSSFAVIQ